MNGQELDTEIRRILMTATRSNALSSAAEIAKLGFPALAAVKMVTDIVLEKERRGMHREDPTHPVSPE